MEYRVNFKMSCKSDTNQSACIMYLSVTVGEKNTVTKATQDRTSFRSWSEDKGLSW